MNEIQPSRPSIPPPSTEPFPPTDAGAGSPEGGAGIPGEAHAEPVGRTERIDAIDVLRGLAVLGILVINITHFALPTRANMNPTLAGGFTGADFGYWVIAKLFFEMRMMSLFSLLFGAGVLLHCRRLEARGFAPRGIVLRRLAWLWVFGMIHAYFLWEGDILVAYAVCGALVYPLRNFRPSRKTILAALILPVASVLFVGFGLFAGYARDAAREAESIIAEGGVPDPVQQQMLEVWEELRGEIEGDPVKTREEREAMTGGYWTLFQWRAKQALAMQTFVFLLFAVWRICGLMLLGMAFLEWGILSARCSPRFYATLCVVGYGAGLSLEALGIHGTLGRDFDVLHVLTVGMQATYFASLLVALGHLGLIMLLVQRYGTFGILGRLAAVGRMAFSNYIGQTLVATTLFYGWGFRLWDNLDRSELAVVLLSIWVFQLMISPWWLDRFRMGPLEWLWRSLTYRERPPFRRPSLEAGPSSPRG